MREVRKGDWLHAKMKSMKFMLYTLFTVMLLFVVPDLSFAQQSPLVPKECATNVSACNFCTLLKMANNIINLLFELLVIAAVILVVVAGFKLVTSAGDVSAYEHAKSMLTNVIIGFVIVMSAWFIVDTIFKMLVKEKNFGVWNKIEGIECGGIKNEPIQGP